MSAALAPASSNLVKIDVEGNLRQLEFAALQRSIDQKDASGNN